MKQECMLLLFFIVRIAVLDLMEGAPLMAKPTPKTWVTTDVECPDNYKVSVFVPADKLLKNSKMTFRSSLCFPKYENRFCLDEDKSYNWKDYQPCNLVNGSTIISCPQYTQFSSFKEFKTWTSRTTTVKIRGYDHTNGTSTVVAVETKSVVVTPIFRCPYIDLVGPGHPMFHQNERNLPVKKT